MIAACYSCDLEGEHSIGKGEHSCVKEAGSHTRFYALGKGDSCKVRLEDLLLNTRGNV